MRDENKKGVKLLNYSEHYIYPFKNINHGLFYLDGQYYELFGYYKLYLKSKKENNKVESRKYLEKSKEIIKNIEDILLKAGEDMYINEAKKTLNEIWSLKEEYLKLKKDIED